MSPAQALWDRLHQAGVVSAAAPPAIEEATPWYIRAMLGIAGWIAAVFLLGFIAAALKFVVDDETAALVVGVALIVAAYAIFRVAGSAAFFSQFGLATSLAGQALFAIGLFGLLGADHALPWLMLATAAGALAVALPNFTHRVWCGYAAASALLVALAMSGLYFLSTGLIAAAVALVWLTELDWARHGAVLRPIGYGLTLAQLQVAGPLLFAGAGLRLFPGRAATHQWLQPWMGEMLAAAVLLATVLALVRQAGLLPLRRDVLAALAACALVGAASLEAPGIAAGLTVMLLGFARGNRPLTGLGILGLLLYLSAYYYNLHTTLLVKSQVLALTGAALLAARWAALKWWPSQDEAGRA